MSVEWIKYWCFAKEIYVRTDIKTKKYAKVSEEQIIII